jgi:hypothetical protein
MYAINSVNLIEKMLNTVNDNDNRKDSSVSQSDNSVYTIDQCGADDFDEGGCANFVKII